MTRLPACRHYRLIRTSGSLLVLGVYLLGYLAAG